jgi:glycosyltransferase involved in cell wall biosynthesis
METIFLIHQDFVQHYRVSIYNYLSGFLEKHGYKLIVISEGIQENNPFPINFNIIKISLSAKNLIKIIRKFNPKITILFVNLKYRYLFPIILFLKLMHKKVLYWGHGKDLGDKNSKIKYFFYNLEHHLVDAIILYAPQLKKFINKKFYPKTFIANNTLNFAQINSVQFSEKAMTLAKYSILTKKNVICSCRIMKRKRIDELIAAFRIINRSDLGLIIIGSDQEGILSKMAVSETNIYMLGPLFGNKVIELLQACDLYCIPGAIGLNIVDAFYCGLPMITEDVDDHGPEIMYLKNGINGFVVAQGDINGMAEKIVLLLDNTEMLKQFSLAAKLEIETNGHIDRMCNGFLSAINFSLR